MNPGAGGPVLDSSIVFPQGIATFNVTAHSAVIWVRIETSSQVEVHLFKQLESKSEFQGKYPGVVNPNRDSIALVQLHGLVPGTRYHYHVYPVRKGDQPGKILGGPSAEGKFVTPPTDNEDHVRFVWSGDLGGKSLCRRVEKGYQIFDRMRATNPVFALFVGDTIYADHPCSSPPNIPGSDFVAMTLPQFRAKHRYQREDTWLRRFLAEVPIFAVWDDHEVRNDFSGPHEPKMAVGRQAFQEYWKGEEEPDQPGRLYSKFQWGPNVEVFLLDTRQYRSADREKDGEKKTMLGIAQRAWLLEGLRRSQAVWKIIVSSVPLSIPKGPVPPHPPANDSWSPGKGGTGFRVERDHLIHTILNHHIRNVVWVSADVHFAQVLAYDPDGDGHTDFYEFIGGPLSALPRQPMKLEYSLRPQIVYEGGGFVNFGKVDIHQEGLSVDILDERGKTKFHYFIPVEADISK